MFDKLCLFAHFDQDNILEEYVLHYLKAIRATGFEIIVISTSRLSAEDVAHLRCIAHDVILRENKGHDFASWSLGIDRYASNVSGQLLIANDSVYGPIGDLTRTLDRLISRKADVYGIIKSKEIAPHLQSWFIIFEPSVHNSKVFRSIFSQKFAEMTKNEIILKGEVGLSQTLIAQGYKITALFDGKLKNGKNLEISSNYSHSLWREIIIKEEIPFLKVELLRLNPSRIPSLADWKGVVSSLSPDLVPMIETHLVRTMRDRPHQASFLHNFPTSAKSFYNFATLDYTYNAAGNKIASKVNLLNYSIQRIRSKTYRRIIYIATYMRRISVALKKRIFSVDGSSNNGGQDKS